MWDTSRAPDGTTIYLGSHGHSGHANPEQRPTPDRCVPAKPAHRRTPPSLRQPMPGCPMAANGGREKRSAVTDLDQSPAGRVVTDPSGGRCGLAVDEVREAGGGALFAPGSEVLGGEEFVDDHVGGADEAGGVAQL